MNRNVLLVSFAAGLALMACSSVEAPKPAAESAAPAAVVALQEVDVDQLKQRLDAGENVYLLDVRMPAELAEHGLIKGAVNIPIDELEGRLAEVPKDRPVVAYCMRGGRAERASELLQKAGHEGVQYGGILAWKEKGYPVVYPEGGAAGKAAN
jgi:rhodanese-related sulfurtransferase